jgi:hypothetical protein
MEDILMHAILDVWGFGMIFLVGAAIVISKTLIIGVVIIGEFTKLCDA